VAGEEKGTGGRRGDKLGELLEKRGEIAVDGKGLSLRPVAPGGRVEDDAVIAAAAP
jgi:hypothetical protein